MSQWNAPFKAAPEGWTHMIHPDLPGGDPPLVTLAAFENHQKKGWLKLTAETAGDLTGLLDQAATEQLSLESEFSTEGQSPDAEPAVDAEPESEAASESRRTRRTKSSKED